MDVDCKKRDIIMIWFMRKVKKKKPIYNYSSFFLFFPAASASPKNRNHRSPVIRFFSLPLEMPTSLVPSHRPELLTVAVAVVAVGVATAYYFYITKKSKPKGSYSFSFLIHSTQEFCCFA